ncbi:MAG: tetratricopeptide repeat protein [Bacteroidales bacterium]|nr:tetratricopeptide repeat protein [Bacteroidales bacterium]
MRICRILPPITLLLMLSSALCAQSSDSLFAEGNRLMNAGHYAEAVRCYESIVGQGQHSAALYYNLGNAHFKQNDYPSAILCYERALLLAPSDDDIRFNLDLARTFTIDVIEPLPQLLVARWASSLTHLLSSNAWAYIALLAFALALVGMALFWFMRRPGQKRLFFGLSVAMLLLFALALVASMIRKNELERTNTAIIFEPSVAVKSTPDSSGMDLFILHAGTKVRLLRNVGSWFEVQIADGNKGWMEKSSFKKI